MTYIWILFIHLPFVYFEDQILGLWNFHSQPLEASLLSWFHVHLNHEKRLQNEEVLFYLKGILK